MALRISLGVSLSIGTGLAAQVPDVDVAEVLRFPAEAAVHVAEAMQAGGAVKLEVDVQHSALCTVKAEPAFALRDGDGQFDERERLARLGRVRRAASCAPAGARRR